MTVTQICLLGQFRCRVDASAVSGIDARRVQELFSYLLLYRHRVHHREVLASLLCDGATTAQARKGLRQALWQLQTALGEYAGGDLHDILLVDSEWVGVNPHVSLWLDIAELERAYAAVEAVPGRQFDAPQQELVAAAVAHYAGDLLEGWYHDWCIYERERLQSIYLLLLDKLTDYHEAHAQYEQAIRCATETLRFDRARECAHRRLMRLHHLAGDRTAALRQYQLCVTALYEELDVPPSARTEHLYRQIRGDQPANGSAPRAAEAPLSLPRSTPELPPNWDGKSLSQLHQMRGTLAALQAQLDHCIRTVEQTLNS